MNNDLLGQSRRRWRWEQQQQRQKQQVQQRLKPSTTTGGGISITPQYNRFNVTNDIIDLTDDDALTTTATRNTTQEQQHPRNYKISVPLLRYPSFSSSRALTGPTSTDMPPNSRKNSIQSSLHPIKNEEADTDNQMQQRHGTCNFTVATWNIWFGPPHPDKRMEHIASIITNQMPSTTTATSAAYHRPIVVGLQEVTQQLSNTLFPLLQKEGYTILCQPDIADSYGCAIAVQTDNSNKRSVTVRQSGFLPFTNTIMERGLLWVLIDIVESVSNNVTAQFNHKKKNQSQITSVLFTTTHLESFVFGHAKTNLARQKQLQQSIQFIEQFLAIQRNAPISVAFLTGDLNWDNNDDHEIIGDDASQYPSTPKKQKISNIRDPPLLPFIQSFCTLPWIDAYLVTKSHNNNIGELGFTYDAKYNPMLKGGYLQRRFDRCLVQFPSDSRKVDTSSSSVMMHSQNEYVIGTAIHGKEAIPGITWDKPKRSNGGISSTSVPVCPSDHYALSVTIQLSVK